MPEILERTFEIKNKLGLHARPAALFVQLTNQYKQTKIRVRVIRNENDTQEVDGKSIMGLMMLAAEKGAQLLLKIEGENSQELMDKLAELIETKFGEE